MILIPKGAGVKKKTGAVPEEEIISLLKKVESNYALLQEFASKNNDGKDKSVIHMLDSSFKDNMKRIYKILKVFNYGRKKGLSLGLEGPGGKTAEKSRKKTGQIPDDK